VNQSCTFNMTGGTIFGNTASGGLGGGVFTYSGGTFRISNGTIYGSNEGDTLSNIATNGGAALYASGTAQRGKWNGSSWSDLVSLPGNSSTIRVLNGALQ